MWLAGVTQPRRFSHAEASELLKDSKRQQAELQEVLAGFQVGDGMQGILSFEI